MITEIFSEEIKQGQVTVENYLESTKENNAGSQREQAGAASPNIPDGTQESNADKKQEDQSKTKVHKTVTVVVLLDARQTRVLITPRRRDPAVDQWEELQMLSKDVARPKGSIIIVIYGDETSEALKDIEIIEDKWNQIFQFNDEHAPFAILKARCFSLSKAFSDHQKRTLRNYMHEIALFPSMNDVKDILVIGRDDQINTFRHYLKQHPFLHLRKPSTADAEGMTTDELFSPGYQEPEEGHRIVRVYHYKTKTDFPISLRKPENTACPQYRCSLDEDPCEDVNGWLNLRGDISIEEEGDPTRLRTKVLNYSSWLYKYIYSNYQHYWVYPLPVFDRVILVCNESDSCFKDIYEQRILVAGCVKHCLDSKHIRTSQRFDILPINIDEQQQQSVELKELMVKIIQSFIREEHSTTVGDCMVRLLESNKNDDDWLLKIYVMYLCHAGFQYVANDEEFAHLEPKEPQENTTDAITAARREVSEDLSS